MPQNSPPPPPAWAAATEDDKLAVALLSPASAAAGDPRLKLMPCGIHVPLILLVLLLPRRAASFAPSIVARSVNVRT